MTHYQSEFVEHRSFGLDAELRLWASVMELACRDYLSGGSLDHQQAENWIFDQNPDEEFNSFPNLCDALGLDTIAVREALSKMYNGKVRKIRWVI